MSTEKYCLKSIDIGIVNQYFSTTVLVLPILFISIVNNPAYDLYSHIKMRNALDLKMHTTPDQPQEYELSNK